MGSGAGKRPSAVAPPTYGDLTIYVAQDPVDFRLPESVTSGFG